MLLLSFSDVTSFSASENHKPNGSECALLRKALAAISKPQRREKVPAGTATQAGEERTSIVFFVVNAVHYCLEI